MCIMYVVKIHCTNVKPNLKSPKKTLLPTLKNSENFGNFRNNFFLLLLSLVFSEKKLFFFCRSVNSKSKSKLFRHFGKNKK